MPRSIAETDTILYHQMVRPLMIDKLGKDPTRCEQCGKKLTHKKEPIIHHTKYENATIYDLQFVCWKCNCSSKNRGLK